MNEVALLVALQRWPAVRHSPSAAAVAARSRSASSQTMRLFFPPNSKASRFRIVAGQIPGQRRSDGNRAGETNGPHVRVQAEIAAGLAPTLQQAQTPPAGSAPASLRA